MQTILGQVVFLSATPGDWELEASSRVVEQIVQDPQIRRETKAIKQAGRWEDHPERHGRWSLRTDEPA